MQLCTLFPEAAAKIKTINELTVIYFGTGGLANPANCLKKCGRMLIVYEEVVY